MKRVTPSWMKTPLNSFVEKVALLKLKAHRINEMTEEGKFLRNLKREVEAEFKEAKARGKQIDPLQWFKPSYEQALVLNAWLYGIMWIGIYTCNRMGKTAVLFVNFLLWIMPNKKTWKVFRRYHVGDVDPDPDVPKEDPNNPNWGKLVEVLPRPSFYVVKKIAQAVKRRPLDVAAPDPHLPHYHAQNREYLQWLQKEVPEAFQQAYPNPPWDQDGMMWYGGPDHDHFKQIIMPIWRQWLPIDCITKDVETDRTMTIEVHFTTRSGKKKVNVWKFVGKSFDAKTEKWSSGAVDAILVTEGMPPDKWKEIKARFKDPAIGGHDYTPFEPANVGAAVALASKIMKGIEPIPLPSFVFSKWSVHAAPRHIISQDKYEGLVSSYKNDPEGKARLEGEFYTSSALVLSFLRRDIHLLPWTPRELFARYPRAHKLRGIDPGLDHPTACAWVALLPTNQFVVYRMLCETGLNIDQRCKKIIEMSNNRQEVVKWGPNKDDYYLREVHPNPNSEVFTANPIDYHVFKKDETTGQSYATNYLVQGLNINESVHTNPEDRAMLLDNFLALNKFYPDLITQKSPAPRIYFLKDEPGILPTFLKWEEFYWDRKRSGEDKGAPKDKVPSHGDDELDAVCYVTSGPYRWTPTLPHATLPRDNEPQKHLIKASREINQIRRRALLYTPLQPLQNNSQIVLGPDGKAISSPSGHVSIFGEIEPEPNEDPYDYNRY